MHGAGVRANLDFRIDDRTVYSQYDLDGYLAMRITIRKPQWTRLPIRTSAANVCQFRGMLMKSSIYFHGRIGVGLPGAAKLLIGDSPRTAPLKELDISPRPLYTAGHVERTGGAAPGGPGRGTTERRPPQQRRPD
jgi:hypothetical protein